MTTDAAILAALRAAESSGVSGADLAQRLGLSRAAVWARIEELRTLGYEIEASPHRGYQLNRVPDLLHGDDLLSLLDGSQVIGRDIRVFQQTTSTNDVVERLARDGVAEGVVVFAESQTEGRGRLGRRWDSPPGKGLWFSVLLRPRLGPRAVTRLTIASATALVRMIRDRTGLEADIKWPNDVMIRGKKVAGVLTELSAELDSVRHVVLGIGLDVNIEPHEFPEELRSIATSLRAELGRPIRRAEVAVSLLRELDRDYRRVCSGRFMEVAEEWGGACSTLGRRVRLRMGPRVETGLAEALDEDGALLLRTEHGHLRRVVGGDLTVEKG